MAGDTVPMQNRRDVSVVSDASLAKGAVEPVDETTGRRSDRDADFLAGKQLLNGNDQVAS